MSALTWGLASVLGMLAWIVLVLLAEKVWEWANRPRGKRLRGVSIVPSAEGRRAPLGETEEEHEALTREIAEHLALVEEMAKRGYGVRYLNPDGTAWKIPPDSIHIDSRKEDDAA